MASASQKPLQTAFVYGFVSGVALGIGEIILGLTLGLFPYSLAILIGRLALIMLVLAYLYAGYHAARKTGHLFAGTLAGAFTGAFGVATLFFLSFFASFIHMYLQIDPLTFAVPTATFLFSPMLSPLARIILTFAFYGAIVGTVGGFIGKQRSLH